MCIACELGFWSMIDALPPEQRERILREQAEQFACETAQVETSTAPKSQDERRS
jgi:hypothetical protein